jgi:hypothetical protein
MAGVSAAEAAAAMAEASAAASMKIADLEESLRLIGKYGIIPP